MIAVSEALARLFALVTPMASERVPLVEALGRVLAEPVAARLTQPPFAASAMDGYALAAADVAPGARFRVVGEAAAGHPLAQVIGKGEAARISTGAALPAGCDRVVIQEDVSREGDVIVLGETLDDARHVRAAGGDFREGWQMAAPRLLRPADLALLAAMNIDAVPVARRPVVALIGTGDELVQPGETPGAGQIIASNNYGLHGLLSMAGARVRMLPIARDTVGALQQALELAQGADLIVTSGGASVGDHDLVAQAADLGGLERSFYKVAMRPGKPLMAGRLGAAMLVGLPGNPVSAMVCGQIFLLPVLRAMQGLPRAAAPRLSLPLGAAVAANGPREHYMRAMRRDGRVSAFDDQDSAMLSVLAEADCLLVRPPSDPERAAGEMVEIIPI